MKQTRTTFSKSFSLTDIVSISDFSRRDIEAVLERAAGMEKTGVLQKKRILAGKMVATLFFEPSTRTRMSFESAAQSLGAGIISSPSEDITSTKKGETVSDTVKMVESYADIIVLRHYIEGAARRAAEISKKPVVNAGDGSNQHPTQTLVDLYTMKKEFGRINGLRIGVMGDLKYGRTVHSLAKALSLFLNIHLYCISPEALKMPKIIVDEIKDSVRVMQGHSFEEYVPQLDVLYVTRIQKERFPDPLEYERVKNVYILGKSILENAKKGFRIMHPLPRINEVSTELDDSPEAAYFRQAANGIPVRQAILEMLSQVKK